MITISYRGKREALMSYSIMIKYSFSNIYYNKLLQQILYQKYITFTQHSRMNFGDSIRSICPKTTLVIQIIGMIIIIKKLYALFKRLKGLLNIRKDLKKRYGANSWVFITGSSDGIGKALAFAFAKQGFNIILSARTVSKLEMVQKELIQKYPSSQIKILPADYKKAVDWEYVRGLLDQIADLDISIVVNNVGVDVCDKYIDIEPNRISDVISVNCYPVAFINRYFLPILDKRTQQRKIKCAILNVSSLAGVAPMPYLQVYAASKAYVDRFSQSLNYEHPGLDIVSIKPAEVSTPMTFHKPIDIFTITPDQCASGILNQMGHTTSTEGHWTHQIQGWLQSIVPQGLFNFVYVTLILPGELKRRKAM